MSFILPFIPLITLLTLAIVTRRMAESMVIATLVAMVMLHHGDMVEGTIGSFYGTLEDSTFQFTLMMVCAFGAEVRLFQESGGLQGFASFMKRFIKGPRSALVFAWVISLALFVDEYLNALTTGFSMSNITDRNGIPREHLAMQVNSMSTSLCIAVPLTSWTAFTIKLIEKDGLSYMDYVHAIPAMFYPILSVLMCILLAVGVLPKAGELKEAYRRVENGGPAYVKDESGKPLVDLGELDPENVSTPLFLVIPMVSLVAGTLYFDKNLLYGMVVALFCQFIMYVFSRKMKVMDFLDHSFEGMRSMMMIAVVLFFGFTLSDANEKLGMFDLVIGLVSEAIPVQLIPLITFALVGFLVFASGSCWIIMLITIPIFIPLAVETGVSPVLVLGALMSGVGMGYNLCFYADTIFMTNASTGVGNMTIIKTTIPYGIGIAVLSVIGYIIAGFLA